MAAVGAGFASGAGAVDCASAVDNVRQLNAVIVASVFTIVCLRSFDERPSRVTNSRRKWLFRWNGFFKNWRTMEPVDTSVRHGAGVNHSLRLTAVNQG